MTIVGTHATNVNVLKKKIMIVSNWIAEKQVSILIQKLINIECWLGLLTV